MAHRIPTADEINVHDSLDERVAVANFLGKDLEQAQALFRENFLHYYEDLMWMGPKAFRFYLPAAIHYLRSPEADGDSDEVNCFCGLLEFRLDVDPDEVAPVTPILRDAIAAILENIQRYDRIPEIYGDVAGRYRALLTRVVV